MGNHCCTSDKNTELLDTRGQGVVKKGSKSDKKPISKYDTSITPISKKTEGPKNSKTPLVNKEESEKELVLQGNS